MNKIVLASASPRRKELLSLITKDFEICPDNSPEEARGKTVGETVCALAEQKCFNVSDKFDENRIIIGADTVVALGEKILGKPKDEKDAKNMLKLLSGKCHSVYTGVCVMQKSINKAVVFFEKTDVYFYDLNDSEINAYVATGEPADKAGAYGIQQKGGLFVKKVDGDYNSVVGLPVAKLYRVLKNDFGFEN